MRFLRRSVVRLGRALVGVLPLLPLSAPGSTAAPAALPVAAREGWTLTAAEALPPPADGITHSKQTLAGPARIELTLHVIAFDSGRYTFRVIDQEPAGQASLEEVMRGHHCLAGTNGGYFRTDFDPVGLLLCDGRQIEPETRARLLSGALIVRRNHHIAIVRASRPLPGKGTRQALQCGPFLVENGQVVPGLNGTHPAERVAVVTDGWRRWGLVVGAGEVTLADFAAVLADPALLPDGLKIATALNLDGGHSSSMWALQPGHEPFYLREGGSVRDFVGIVPREGVR